MSIAARSATRLVRLALITVIGGLVVGLVLYLLGPQVVRLGHIGEAQAAEIPDLEQLSERSVVYAADGSVLDLFKQEENRKPVTLAQVPQVLINAVLDVEDRNFYAHQGVDVRSVARAFVRNSGSNDIVQGGSTITQQLVKNSLLTPEQTLSRKAKEAVLALRIEQKMTKEEILERYLNIIYFGNGAYGVEAASETYFDKPVADVTAPEAALLAGLISCPTRCDPVRNPKTATDRRSTVLGEMARSSHLTPDQAAQFAATPLPAKIVGAAPPARGTYFVEEVRKTLLADPRLGDTETLRENALYRGGLQIYTTLDPKMQADAEASVKANLPDTGGKYDAALITVEPSTGKVRAMVGGPDARTYPFNEATQAYRQIGSAFKPFVLLAGLENGFGPSTTVDESSPCSIQAKGYGPPHVFNNDDGDGSGFGDLTAAMAGSVNCAYLRLGVAVGLDKVAAMAKRLGLASSGRYEIKPVLSLPIGTADVTPISMASAYSAIANDGVLHKPTYIDHIDDRTGKLLLDGVNPGQQVLSKNTARIAAQVMRAVIERGTAFKNGRIAGRQLAGKTGTATEHTNIWFVGFTPQLSTAVWMGHRSDSRDPMVINGRKPFGGDYPTKIWQGFMSQALEGLPAVIFPLPDPRQIPKGKSVSGTGIVGTAPSFTGPRVTGGSPPTSTRSGGNGGGATTAPSVTGPPRTTAPPGSDPPPTVP